jgi:acylphosphatase
VDGHENDKLSSWPVRGEVMKLVHILVSGRVQGVGYRAFAHRQAVELGTCGQVRNLADGRVELIVQADDETLKELCRRLMTGPRLAQVSALAAKDIAGPRHFEGFSIEEDGKEPWFAC